MILVRMKLRMMTSFKYRQINGDDFCNISFACSFKLDNML